MGFAFRGQGHPLKFPDFIPTQKHNPRTHLKDPNADWDFWSLSPEALHQIRRINEKLGAGIEAKLKA